MEPAYYTVTSINGDYVYMVSDSGIIIRMHGDTISKIGRNTRGVRLMRLRGGKVATVAITERDEEAEVEMPEETAADVPVEAPDPEDEENDTSVVESGEETEENEVAESEEGNEE